MPRWAHRGARVTLRRIDDASDDSRSMRKDGSRTCARRRARDELVRRLASVVAAREQNTATPLRDVDPHALATRELLPTTFPTTWGAN
jgi:hypothetical protein